MDNNIVISALKSEGEMDDSTDLAHAWRFHTAKSWIKSIENDAMDYFKNIIAGEQQQKDFQLLHQ